MKIKKCPNGMPVLIPAHRMSHQAGNINLI